MKPVIPLPEYKELPYDTVVSLVNLAYIAGMKQAAEICKNKDPRPDQYSEQYEFAESRIVRACAKQIETESQKVEY